MDVRIGKDEDKGKGQERGTRVLGDKRKGLVMVFILQELGIFILVYRRRSCRGGQAKLSRRSGEVVEEHRRSNAGRRSWHGGGVKEGKARPSKAKQKASMIL